MPQEAGTLWVLHQNLGRQRTEQQEGNVTLYKLNSFINQFPYSCSTSSTTTTCCKVVPLESCSIYSRSGNRATLYSSIMDQLRICSSIIALNPLATISVRSVCLLYCILGRPMQLPRPKAYTISMHICWARCAVFDALHRQNSITLTSCSRRRWRLWSMISWSSKWKCFWQANCHT